VLVAEAAARESKTPESSRPPRHRCACGGEVRTGGECESCRNMRLAASRSAGGRQSAASLQRKAVHPTRTDSVPPSVRNVLGSPGKPLDSSTRGFFEPRLGQDFSRVRVHSDPLAGDSARAVNASAYTVGQHIVFGTGRYAAETASGRSLLAHELTHVVQQRGTERTFSATRSRSPSLLLPSARRRSPRRR
jgi:hypothetical protein